MAQKPLVSVVMNCFNGEAYLNEAIDSVYAQDMDGWEIILFDNNSTDQSADIAKGYDQRLRYIKNDVTEPLGHARNVAVSHARGKYIAFLDCDDLFEPSKLSKQLEVMNRKNPNGRRMAMAYCDSMRIDKKGNNIAPFSCDHQLYHGDVYVYLMRECFIAMSTCFIDREVLEQVGGFNESYGQVEDWDLWLKIARKYDIALVNESLAKTRVHSGNLSRNFDLVSSETTTLFEHVICETPAQRKARKQALVEYKLRANISQLLCGRKYGIKSGIIQLCETCSSCFCHPWVSCQMAKKFVNPKMLRTYYHKYFKK